MTYEDALKAAENGQNVMIWIGEEYLHPEYVKKILECPHEIRSREQYKEYKKILESTRSDKWSAYTELDVEWELKHYRKCFEHLSYIQDDFLKELLGRGYDNDYTDQYFREKMIVVDAFHTLYSLKRNQKIFMFTTIVFLVTTIIALMV